MAERPKPRGRMPAKIKVTIRFVPADYATTWKPLVDEVLAQQASETVADASQAKRALREKGNVRDEHRPK